MSDFTDTIHDLLQNVDESDLIFEEESPASPLEGEIQDGLWLEMDLGDGILMWSPHEGLINEDSGIEGARIVEGWGARNTRIPGVESWSLFETEEQAKDYLDLFSEDVDSGTLEHV